MADKLKGSVGCCQRGGNLPQDSMQVISLLNVHITSGALSHLKLLSTSCLGSHPDVIAAITGFQTKVVKLRKPDGRVDRGGKTIRMLRNVPKTMLQTVELLACASTNFFLGPVGGVPQDLWDIGLLSLMDHASHPQIVKFIVMFVDFRKKQKEIRLWMVDIEKRTLLLNTRVSHGEGKKRGQKFSNIRDSHDSSVGAYVTLRQRLSGAGKLGTRADGKKKRDVAAVVEGLDSTNNRAKSRAILIHGASYVSATRAAPSWGCFATRPEDNRKIVARMQNGGFIYAYAGESFRAKN